MPTYPRKTTLLATGQQQSVLNTLDLNRHHSIAYSPYGHHLREAGLLGILGFNGEQPDPLTGHYHLGKGYRQYNPVLMRFNSPDSWSPFGKGGVNTYAYCEGDPANRTDPSGHKFKVKALIKSMKETHISHHSNPGKLPVSTRKAIKETAKKLGGDEAIVRLAGQAEMSPESFLLTRVVNERFAATQLYPPRQSWPSSQAGMVSHIKPLIEANNFYADILKGTSGVGYRPVDLLDIYSANKTALNDSEYILEIRQGS